jgi:hypothetical protein
MDIVNSCRASREAPNSRSSRDQTNLELLRLHPASAVIVVRLDMSRFQSPRYVGEAIVKFVTSFSVITRCFTGSFGSARFSTSSRLVCSPSIPLKLTLSHELSNLFLFSRLFNLSTRFRCIFSAIFSYRSFSSLATRLSRMAWIRRCRSASFSSFISFSLAFTTAISARFLLRSSKLDSPFVGRKAVLGSCHCLPSLSEAVSHGQPSCSNRKYKQETKRLSSSLTILPHALWYHLCGPCGCTRSRWLLRRSRHGTNLSPSLKSFPFCNKTPGTCGLSRKTKREDDIQYFAEAELQLKSQLAPSRAWSSVSAAKMRKENSVAKSRLSVIKRLGALFTVMPGPHVGDREDCAKPSQRQKRTEKSLMIAT